jgi:hypothetical protein
VVDRDHQGPAVRVELGCSLEGPLDLGAAALFLAEPAGEGLKFEQVQAAVVAELDIAAAVAATAVQPLRVGVQGAEQHRHHVLVDRLDVVGLPWHAGHLVSESR